MTQHYCFFYRGKFTRDIFTFLTRGNFPGRNITTVMKKKKWKNSNIEKVLLKFVDEEWVEKKKKYKIGIRMTKYVILI